MAGNSSDFKMGERERGYFSQEWSEVGAGRLAGYWPEMEECAGYGETNTS